MIKVNEEKERYVVYHEWREESHTFAVSEELWLAKKELSEVKFKRFIHWLENHLDPLAKNVVFECLQLILEVEEEKST